MTSTNDKAFNMADKQSNRIDPTEEDSDRGDSKTTRIAREHETDRENGNAPFGNIVSPDGDDAGENRVTTSLSDD